ncbi:acyl-CoA-like ligand-binding transcription factor [Plantactinospora soyae]|uniref:AcrR family transcriptional regulator n=1 Tax=Plantactinospora soyae TaxID=1544732 RepID=A0A927MEX7_9ACTN|nr:TetR family transcriptional regulator [Plantactinospora soyae]MBE1492507.1 AcrR family transcriptional regulator [Plantactinospora soyae]
MPGLRERNKARTRAEIRRQAMRLFRDQGYASTTVEQIAAAAEVSQSTFFRYFPSKEDVVLRDDLDPLVFDAFVAAPPELTPVQAFRAAIRTVFLSLSPEQRAEEWDRHRLTQSVPELRNRNLDALIQAMGLLTEAVARRVGRQPDDLAVRAFVGAVVGVGLAVLLNDNPDPANYVELFDEGLAQLEAGLPL